MNGAGESPSTHEGSLPQDRIEHNVVSVCDDPLVSHDADPSRYLEASTVPGWYVITDQGVVLSARFPNRRDVELEYQLVVSQLATSLRRERKPQKFINERVAAVGVEWGVLIGAWGKFESRRVTDGASA
jgi:hypothetical protein